MMTIRQAPILMTCVVAIASAPLLDANPVITEFMAANAGGLQDEDGESSDWIEIRNEGGTAVDLAGWRLTDDAADLSRWVFPSHPLQPGEFLVVFASGKNRAVAGAELHTSFALDQAGEYLALVSPAGVPISAFAPAYPPQKTNYSFGTSVPSTELVLVTENDVCKARVPDAAYDAAVGTTWRTNTPGFDESSWASGTQGVGYERSSGFQDDINLDVESAMFDANTSVYIRIPISADLDPSSVQSLTLRMKYDDGFAAFINGAAPANGSSFAPSPLAWNSTTFEGNNPESAATVFQDFDISDVIPSLDSGTNNVLAIQGLNATTTSSDLLFRAELVAQVAEAGLATTGFFAVPTPGVINGNTTYEGFLSDTNFDTGRGFYSSAFTEIVRCPDPGSTIIYTTDGSLPSLTNGTQVPAPDAASPATAPVPIATTTVLRAIAVKTDFKPTNIDTQTYLFAHDVLTQDGAGLPTPHTSTSTWDYEMDPDVVNDPRYPNLADDLLTLPTLSIVMPVEDVWGANGVYSNPRSFGSAWERACSVELINPDGSPGYQVDGGLRIHGSGSRKRAIGKKSMRLVFRKQYGSSRFKYPLWGPTGPDEVANLILRGSYFDSWTFERDSDSADGITRTNAVQFRTHFATVAHARTGNHTIASNWVHLYINGQYWGPYNTHERPDAEFAEYHLGGDETDYTVIKHGVEVVEGSRTAWDALMALCNPYNAANHQAILDHVDEEQFIDYIFMNIWGGNNDWPHNNWYVIRNDLLGGPFRFYVWDPENYVYSTSADRTGVANNNTPAVIYDRLRRDPEFKVHFGDHVHRYMFNDGIYTMASMQDLWQDIADELEPAMNCEAARWGDEHTAAPYNTIDHYLPHVAYRRNTYMPTRHHLVLNQLRNKGLYPGTAAPVFSLHGGTIVSGHQLTMTNPGGTGTLHYTLDGTDPRLAGGAVSSTAQTYSSAVTLPGNVTVKARIKNTNGEWSALNVADFTIGVPPDASNLAISEIHYHPEDASPSEIAAGFTDQDDFEFIELMNTGTETLDLSGLRFVEGITFDFSALTDPLLFPGERLVLARNITAYTLRYGSTANVVDTYTGRLSNDGEILTLMEGNTVLLSFAYNDVYPWSRSADGQGASLVLIDPTANPTPSQATSWRPSGLMHGTPGFGETLPPPPVDPLADTDGNGLADLVDYAIPAPPLARIITIGPDEFLTIHFTVNPAAEGATVTAQYSDNLDAWSSGTGAVAFVSETYNGDGTVTHVWRSLSPISGTPKQFLRLAVEER